MLQGYGRNFEEIFPRYGLSVGLPMVPGATITDYPLKLPYRFLEDHALKELNIAVGEAHESFCRSKRDVEVLERQLKETGALEIRICLVFKPCPECSKKFQTWCDKCERSERSGTAAG